MTPTLLTLNKISKSYTNGSCADVNALTDFDLTMKKGEFLVLIGPTGCGKTTLLNIITGLESQDSGTIDYTDKLKSGLNMSCVFQHYTLFPWRTILHNVTFALEMRKVPKSDRIATGHDLLGKVGLMGFENAYPHELSGGMRQRAAIAQALASRPKLLLMDEPFGAVDDSTRNELQAMIVDLWAKMNLTILFVTHNIDEALVIADRVLVLSNRPARVIEEFKIEQQRPRDRLSQDFTNRYLKIREALTSPNALR